MNDSFGILWYKSSSLEIKDHLYLDSRKITHIKLERHTLKDYIVIWCGDNDVQYIEYPKEVIEDAYHHLKSTLIQSRIDQNKYVDEDEGDEIPFYDPIQEKYL